MNWFSLSLVSAFSLSTSGALSKRALRHTDGLVMAWVGWGYALPFLLAGLLLVPVPVPALDAAFWAALAILVPLEIAAIVLYMKAIKLSPLSLTIPFMGLSPVFILLIAFLLLGELPAPTGMAGVALIALGAYLLNASSSREGLLGPIRAIRREPGSVLMIIVALIYSITSTVGKIAILHSSPVFFGFFYPLVLTIVLTLVLARRGALRGVASKPLSFVPIGFFTALMLISHFVAISLTGVAYMISVKRTSLIFSVLYGRFLFKEENIGERLIGSAVMMAGVVLITLS